MRKMINNIASVLEGVTTAAIAGHVRPDGDCVGSCMGMYLYLKENYPQIQTDVYLEEVPEVFHFIQDIDQAKQEWEEKEYDLFLEFDVSSTDRIGVAGQAVNTAKITACIDHHITNKGMAQKNQIVPDASSTCEVLYELLEPEKINALLGTEIPEADMIEYLRREEVPVADGQIQVPSWRPDLRCMADIAEEVARYYGYNNIATTLMRGTTTRGGYSETAMLENQAGAAARSLGYSEIITYSFVSPASFDAVCIPKDSPLRKTLKLVNPLGEDTSIMRTIILPSMLDILSRNYAMKNKGVKLYELGRVYLPVDGQDLPEEPRHLIFGTYGEHETFFTMKGEIDALLQLLNVKPAEYVANRENPSYHPGRCADILIDGKLAGTIGQIHPLVAEAYGIGGEVYVADLDFTTIEASLAEERVFHSLPRFPAVTRDLALVCDESLTVGELERCISAAAGKLLRKINLFDIYRGPGIAAGKKSVAFSLELRADDRTLTDEDSTGVVDRVLKALKEEKDVTLR